MKILLLSRYGSMGASSRIRLYQYLPYLKTHGIDCFVAPLLDDDYILSLYSGKSRLLFSIISSYIQRIWIVLNSRSFDLVWLEKELFPWLPVWVERILSHANIPYMVDYDDATFHRYDLNPNWPVRALFKNKISRVMLNAELVVTGNNYLANYALCAGVKRVEFIPTVIDLDRYSIKNQPNSEKFTVGWIGTPNTAKYLTLIKQAMIQFQKQDNISFSFVGSGDVDLNELPIKTICWSEETEVSDIQDFDVGIMPLADSPWERGKCGYKLIQYMACGKPVVASPVGANTEIVEHGVNGFLAESTEEWLEALTILRDNPDMRNKMGAAGRKMVKKKYCLEVTAPKLLSLFNTFRKY